MVMANFYNYFPSIGKEVSSLMERRILQTPLTYYVHLYVLIYVRISPYDGDGTIKHITYHILFKSYSNHSCYYGYGGHRHPK